MSARASALTLLVVIASSSVPGRADEPAARLDLRTGAASNFIWRGGLTFAPLFAPMSISVVHVAVEHLGPGELYAGYWNGTRLSDGVTWPFPYAGYSLVVDALIVDAQYGVFFHSEDRPVDQEHNFQATISHGVGAHLRPRFLFSGDPIRLLGWYGQVGCEAIFVAGPRRLRVDLAAGVSDYAQAPLGPQDLAMILELRQALGDGFSLSVELTMVHAFRLGTGLATVGAFLGWSSSD